MDALLLLAIVGGVAAANYSWLSANWVPPHWDQASHMLSALGYHEVLATCFSTANGVLRGVAHCARLLASVDQFVYGPLFPLAGGAWIFAAGSSVTALAMTNLPFLAMMVGSVYLLGRQMHSRAAGVLAALLLCAYPLVLTTSREFMLEFALLAFTTAAVALLVLSNGFASRTLTLVFGAVTGLAILTKFTFLPFVAGPFLFEAGRLAVHIRRQRLPAGEGRRRIASVVYACLIALAVAALWYGPNRHNFATALLTIVGLDTTGVSRFSFESLTFYGKTMLRDQMALPLFGVFILGLFRMRALRAEHRGLLLVWLASIYAICTLATFKAEHNDIGVLVPAALVSAIGVSSLSRWRTPAIAAVAGVACLQLAVFSLPAPLLAARVGTFGWRGAPTAFPRMDQWQVDRVLQTMADQPARIAVVSDHRFVNGTTAQFYASKNRLPLEITPCWALSDPSSAALERFDFVIAKSDLGWVRRKSDGCFRGVTGQEDYAALLLALEQRSDVFTLAQSAALPDGSALLVYRTAHPTKATPARNE